jgi:hypothetical protein
MTLSEISQAQEVYTALEQLTDDQLQCICENLVYNNVILADRIQNYLTNYFREALDVQQELA